MHSYVFMHSRKFGKHRSVYHIDILNLRNLCSLIVLERPSYIGIFERKKDIFQNLPKLRALYIESQHLKVLSNPRIDKLKHLRYLHVRYNTKLLVSLVKLYQLQFFILITDKKHSTENLPASTLPQGFNNLTNLHTLQFYNENGDYELDYLYYNSKMVNIEKLTLLQNLSKFHVDGSDGMKSLKDLPIGGSFSILNLEYVKCKEEAEEALLNQKVNIDDLIFVWSNTPSSTDTCEEVLEGLEPHRNLEGLEINGYQGVKFPKWMVKENWLPHLQSLRLESYTSLKIVLFLHPRLERLKVEKCLELIQLPTLSDTLCMLALDDCPKLQALTNLSPTVNELIIVDCSKLTRLENLHHCTSLKELSIKKCPMLRREEASLVEGVAEGDTTSCLPHIITDDILLVLEVAQQQTFSRVEYL